MATVAVPSSTRAQAEAVIARQIGRGFSIVTPLEALGTAAAVQLLLALEEAFDVLIDVDEVLPDGTVGGLIGLVILRVRTQAPPPSQPATLIDLAARRAERARRAQPSPAVLTYATRFETGEFSTRFEPIALPPEPVDFPRRVTPVRCLLAALIALGVALIPAAVDLVVRQL